MAANEADRLFVPSREHLAWLAEAWKRNRHPRLAQLHSHVAKQLAAAEPIRELLRAGKRKQDLEGWWAVAQLGDPLDFPRLAAALRAGSQEQVGNKLKALVAREDPRLASYLLDVLEDPPYAGLSSRPLLSAILQALRLSGDRDLAERTSALDHRRGTKRLTATGGFVGLSDDEHDLVTGGDQGVEGGNREFGGSHEDHAHQRAASSWNFLSFLM